MLCVVSISTEVENGAEDGDYIIESTTFVFPAGTAVGSTVCSTIVAEEDTFIEETEALTVEIASISNEDVVFPAETSRIVRILDGSSKCFNADI